MTLGPGQKAKMYALGGRARGGATRGGYVSPNIFITIDGVHRATLPDDATKKVLDSSFTIQDELNETPNTADLTTRGFVPLECQEVIATLGSKNRLTREFGGTILWTTRSIDSKGNFTHAVHVIDFTQGLTDKKVSGLYTSTTVGAIAAALIAQAPPGYTLVVAADISSLVLDTFSYTNQTIASVYSQLMERAGAYWRCDYRKVVRCGATDPSQTDPQPVPNSTTTDLTIKRDTSQQINRVFSEGGGVNAKASIQPGATSLPIEDSAWYNPLGGRIATGQNRFAYAGIVVGNVGSIVGTGFLPTTAPTAASAGGTGMTLGVHDIAVVFKTAAGRSLPGPRRTITANTMAAPTTAPTMLVFDDPGIGPGNGMFVGATVEYKSTFSGAASAGDLTNDTAPSPSSGVFTIQASIHYGAPYCQDRFVSVQSSVDPAVKWIHIWRSVNGGGFTFLSVATNSGSGVPYSFEDGNRVNLTGDPIPTANPNVAQFALSDIELGPTGTTDREIHMTAAGSSQLKLAHAMGDNTTTLYTLAIADGSLGANAPSTDTSGLSQPSNQVPAGATTLPVCGTESFASSGGWAVIGNGQQIIRYTGKTDTSLTGIPPIGVGAITASITYNSSVTVAPQLTGIPPSGDGAIVYPILEGDALNVLTQVDDVAAQALRAAALNNGSDGIVEDYITDNRLSESEALARGRAWLSVRSPLDIELGYGTRDGNTKSGCDASFTLDGVSDYRGVIAPDSPIALWMFDTPVGIDGTLVGGVTFGQAGPTAAAGARGALFDGSTGYLFGVHGAADYFSAAPFSVEAWVKWTLAANDRYVLSKYTALLSGNKGWGLSTKTSGKLNFSVTDTSGGTLLSLDSNISSLNDGAWHHVVVTVDAGGATTMYLDGVAHGTGTLSAGVFHAIGINTLVGAAGAPSAVITTYFSGTIFGVAIYTYALSAARVAAHYANTQTITLKIQRATEGGFCPGIKPTFSGVTASSQRTSYEDFLRQLHEGSR